jgi:hypothetical protein
LFFAWSYFGPRPSLGMGCIANTGDLTAEPFQLAELRIFPLHIEPFLRRSHTKLPQMMVKMFVH